MSCSSPWPAAWRWRAQGAETIDFNREDPIEALLALTDGIGVDRVIDAVGVDANHAHHGPAAKGTDFTQEVKEVAPVRKPDGDNWHPGDGPSQALTWAVQAAAKAGTVSIIGVYPEASKTFPIGVAMNKNLTIRMGNCNHRRYIPSLIEVVVAGVIDPSKVLTQHAPIASAIDAYKAFDKREDGWVKVVLDPQAAAQ